MDINQSFKNITKIDSSYALVIGLKYKGYFDKMCYHQNKNRLPYKKLMEYANNYWIKFHAPDLLGKRALMANCFDLSIEDVPSSIFEIKTPSVFIGTHKLDNTNVKAYYDLIFRYYHEATMTFLYDLNPRFKNVDSLIILEALGRYLTEREIDFKTLKGLRKDQGKSIPTEFECFLLECLNLIDCRDKITDEVKDILSETANIYFQSILKIA